MKKTMVFFRKLGHFSPRTDARMRCDYGKQCHISFFSSYCPQRCLDVARYAFDIDVDNLLETNTNLTLILTTDLG